MPATNKKTLQLIYDERIEPYLDLIRMWTRDGVSVARICKALKVNVANWYEIVRMSEPLREAIRVTREIVDLSLIDSLYKRATGYTAVTSQKEYVYRYNADGSLRDRRLVKEKEIETHVPGDPRLLEYWLAHRIPEEWGPMQIDQNENGNAGVVFLPARIDAVSATAGAAPAPGVIDEAPGPEREEEEGPGGDPGENGDERLRGAPILKISAKIPEQDPSEKGAPEKIKTAK